MKAINANYSVRVGYWASRNNVQEYKVYVVVIRMFNLDFVNTLRQVPKDNPWPVESTNHNYRTHLLCQAKYLLGMNKVDQYLLVEVSNVARNENDPKKWWLWIAYCKIWCKPWCTSRTKRKNNKAWGGGAKNTIIIGSWRKKRLRKQGWKIFWVM